MQKYLDKIRLSIAIPLAVGAVTLMPVAVYAQHGSDDSSTSSGKGKSSQVVQANETETESESAADASATDSARDKAEQLITQKKQIVKQHTIEQKQKACAARAANIKKRADNYATAAQRHLDVFNGIFTKVKTFHDDKKLNVDGYNALVSTATAKQTTAQAAVDALKSADVTIDCTQSDPATAVATLKTATANARAALQDYRKAIKDVIVALKGASTAQSSDTNDSTKTTTGGTQ